MEREPQAAEVGDETTRMVFAALAAFWHVAGRHAEAKGLELPDWSDPHMTEVSLDLAVAARAAVKRSVALARSR